MRGPTGTEAVSRCGLPLAPRRATVLTMSEFENPLTSIPLACRTRRRKEFLEGIRDTGLGPVLLMAGGEIPRAYPDEVYPYRADSNFVQFFGTREPGAAALFDPGDGTTTLFLRERTVDGALWLGPEPGLDDIQTQEQVDRVLPLKDLEDHMAATRGGRQAHTVTVADTVATRFATKLTGEDLDFHTPERAAHPGLIQVLAKIRNHRSPEEVECMRAAAEITIAGHLAAMGMTSTEVDEQTLVGTILGTFATHGCTEAYNSILSVRGEVLHNHKHDNPLQDGDMILLDAGAAAPSGYCADITRCWPVTGEFTAEQAAVYDTVLRAERAGVAACGPGVRYRDVHLASARELTAGLVDLGILKGSVDSLVEQGAHALFFPHGVGHLIGLDVHDMELFGDAVGYAPGRKRSTDFGLKSLRCDVDLAPGMCVTVEPGIYFVPAILQHPEFRSRFAGSVDFDRAETFLAMNDGRGFGGIRLEDDVLITEDGRENLTEEMPIDREDISDLVGSVYGYEG